MMAPKSFKTVILLFRRGLNNVRPSENNVGAEGPSGNFSPENKSNIMIIISFKGSAHEQTRF
ncbi:hypothetical protein ACTHUD_23850, partial [Neisseria sp. P0016.S002]